MYEEQFMESNHKKRKPYRLYTSHGKKVVQGMLAVINGQKALAFFTGDQIIGYTTQEELNKEFYMREDLPQYNLNI